VLLLILSLSCASIYWFLGQTKPESCGGWMKSLCGDGIEGRIWRSLYLGFHPFLHPLSGIVGGSIVEPGTLAGYLIQTIQRLGSIILIFMFLLSVRRRFRLSS